MVSAVPNPGTDGDSAVGNRTAQRFDRVDPALPEVRRREIGARVAMGAGPRDLLRLLMWDSLRPVVLGLAVGAAAPAARLRLLGPLARMSARGCDSRC